MIRRKIEKARLYCFTPDKWRGQSDIMDMVRSQIQGGADVIQLREKKMPAREKLELARAIKKITRKYHVLFIVNDNIDIAYLSQSDGVHLGQDDIPPREARKIMKNRIIGLSTHNEDQYKKAQKEDVDYVAIGPIFPTLTKDDPDSTVGLEELKKILKHKKKKTVAIGGIDYEHISRIIPLGIDCLAVVSAIIKSGDIEETTRKFKEEINRVLEKN